VSTPDVAGRHSVKVRALPIAFALALSSVAGLLTEAVAPAQILAIAGPTALVAIMALSAVCVAIVVIVQFTFVDSQPRLRMLRVIAGIYTVGFAIALAYVALGGHSVVGIGAIWMLGDQQQMLIPVLIWSLAGDVFNTGESRKIFGWIMAWTYAGMIVGLGVATFSPPLFTSESIPLSNLLVINPIACLVIAVWIPWQMRGMETGKGTKERERLRPAITTTLEFFREVPIMRALLIASCFTAMAWGFATIGFSTSAESIIGPDAGTLQTFIGGTTLVILLVGLAYQLLVAPRVAVKMNSATQLLLIPFLSIAAGLVLSAGAALGSLALLAIGLVLIDMPTRSIDEPAQQEVLTLVPDQLRARVSFTVQLVRWPLALLIASLLSLAITWLGLLWVLGLLSAVAAAIALPWALRLRRDWETGLVNWRLRRRKRSTMSILDDL
jgi:hypothetical protein